MCTAMKTLDMQTAPQLFNTISETDCIQPEITGNVNIPQASTNTYLGVINCPVVPDYK